MDKVKRILIVDDDNDFRKVLKEILSDEGYQLLEAPDGVSGIEVFRSEGADLIILDIMMPRMTGTETLPELKKISPDVPVIMMTAHGDIETAVKAIKMGAYDFAVKPPVFEKLILSVQRALEKAALERSLREVDNVLDLSLEHQLGRSEAIRKIIKQIKQVAQTDLSVIIQGETGSGKSVVARMIHDMSRRNEKPFVRLDIGLIPDSLVESELFGYKKGAFTGADVDKVGYFQAASGGTIFIDELENMSKYAQGKFLSIMDRKEVFQLGSHESSSVDIRAISATNRDIRVEIAENNFRDDLFYRLGEFMINIPPLRERSEDIPFFVEKFIQEAGEEFGKQVKGTTDDARKRLSGYHWPGNLRELKNVARRAVLVAEKDMIDGYDIEPLMAGSSTEEGPVFQSLKDEIKAIEKSRIREALAKTDGNKAKAAELLRVSYKSLFDKIREYGLE